MYQHFEMSEQWVLYHIDFLPTLDANDIITGAETSRVNRPAPRITISVGLQDYKSSSLAEVHVATVLSGRLNSQRKRSITSCVLLFDIASRQNVSLGEILLLYALYVSLGAGDLSKLWKEQYAMTVILIEMVIRVMAGQDFETLESEAELPQNMCKHMLKYLPPIEVIGSWRRDYSPAKVAKFRVGLVDHEFRLEDYTSYARNSDRYTSYARGYADHGGLPAPGKTRPTYELDGEDERAVELPDWYAKYARRQELTRQRAQLANSEIRKRK
jgi:hypothetical protein